MKQIGRAASKPRFATDPHLPNPGRKPNLLPPPSHVPRASPSWARLRSWLATLRNATRHLPLVGFGADYLHSLAETFTAYYCYTSGSN
jgi:hypothetical protein